MPARYPETKIKVGVSSCLLGEKVRWNGDHKQDLFVKDLLGKFFEWVPTCPEVEIGMGILRETVQLAGDPKAPRMVGNKTGTDWTARMNRYSKKNVQLNWRVQTCADTFLKTGRPPVASRASRSTEKTACPHRTDAACSPMRSCGNTP